MYIEHGGAIVQGTALVGLDVREADIAQSLNWHDAGDCLVHQRKHPAQSGVEQQRRIVEDEEVIVGKIAWTALGAHGRVDTVNAVGDFVHIGPGLPVRHQHGLVLGQAGAEVFSACLAVAIGPVPGHGVGPRPRLPAPSGSMDTPAPDGGPVQLAGVRAILPGR